MGRISKIDPQLAERIEGSLSGFDDILDLVPQSIQKLIQEVDHADLVVSLKLCSEELKAYLFENMSERKRASVQEDFSGLPAMKINQVEDAQRRILAKLEELRVAGLMRTRAGKDVYI